MQTIITTAADRSLRKTMKFTKLNKMKHQRHKKWFDKNLQKMRNALQYKGFLIRKYPRDPVIRGSYFKGLKEYNKLRKKKMRQFKADIIDTLDDLRSNNVKEYWSLVDKLKAEETTESNKVATSININDWEEYFTKLINSDTMTSTNKCKITQDIADMESRVTFNELDFSITENEIIKSIKKLKNRKSPGPDLIVNEMLKYGQHILLPCITKIFNRVLQSGIYPDNWSSGFVIPIHKKGDPKDPNNYRGITLTSCLGKLFNAVLNNRLDEFITKNKLVHENQIGFSKRSRTSDHIFVLKTLIDKITKRDKGVLYTCFVDFHKAFDTVSHAGLFYKLLKNGIGGMFYRVIKNMYQKTSQQVKTDSLSGTFNSNVGVRQGDNLSPNLFKLFINDFNTWLDEECDPVVLIKRKIACLMYADDLLLLSNSEKGLQSSLDKLNKYCQMWGLTVNLKKTKILIFQSKRKQQKVGPVFKIGGSIVEQADSYKYLGVLFSSSGDFSNARKDLTNRGHKALFKLFKSVNKDNPTPDTQLHLFDHMVKPVLLYGSEVWGCFNPALSSVSKTKQFKLEKAFGKFEMEKIHLRQCRWTLGVNNRSTTDAVLGELGRHPLYIDVVVNMFKYLQYINSQNESSLIYEAFLCNKQLSNTGVYSWYSCIDFMKQELDICNQVRYLNQVALGRIVKNNLIGRYKDKWRQNVHSENPHSKLRTYKLFKQNHIKEPYLKMKNLAHRRSLTKFRISSHQLEIEKGRFQKLPIDDRICKQCNSNQIEDERHFLLVCSSYAENRKILYDKISTKCKPFLTLNNANKFLYIMTCEDIETCKDVAWFVHTSMENRK